MKNFFIAMFLLLLFYSCSSSPAASTSDVDSSSAKKITLKFKYDKVNIMSMIDIVEFIPLETTDESLIGNKFEVISKFDRYYIFDKQQQTVLIFDGHGKFLSKIDKKGQGPYEYTEIHGMQVDDAGNVAVLADTYPPKIIKYNESKNNTIILEDMMTSGFIPFNKGYLFYSTRGNPLEKNNFYLYATDKDGNIADKWLPAHKYSRYSIDKPQIFDVYRDTILFTKPFGQNIYQMSQKGEISVRYLLDYGEELPESLKQMFYDGDTNNFLDASANYVMETYSWFETDQVLLFLYVKRSAGTFNAIFHKQSNKLTILNPYDKEKDLFEYEAFHPICKTGNTFISSADAAMFLVPETKKTLLEKYPELIKTVDLSCLSESSNPILVKYKFK